MEEPTFSVGAFSGTPLPPKSFVTVAATSSKFVIIGLSNGSLSLFDVFGNRLDHHKSVHSAPITSLALGGPPSADSIVASASADGQLRVATLFTNGSSANSNSRTSTLMLSSASVAFVKQVDSPALAIAVDPSFGKPRFGDRIAYANSTGDVAIYTSGWFGGSEVEVSSSSTCPVHSLAWVHNLLAFPSHDGVRIFDTRVSQLVCRVAPPGSGQITRHPSSQQLLASNSPQKEASDKPATPNLPALTNTSKSLDTSEGLWTAHTRVFMYVEDAFSRKGGKEPHVTLIVNWPTGARAVRIGPYVYNPSNETALPRSLDVVFRLERHVLPAVTPVVPPVNNADGSTADVNQASESPPPLLSIVPFGSNEYIALVGTSPNRLAVHLISSDGLSIRHMILPHRSVRDASLLTVPGGDPLALVIAHPDDSITDPSQSQTMDESGPHNGNVMYVRMLSTAERVKWLLGQERFQDALTVAQTAPGGSLRRAEVSLVDVGEQFLESLKDASDYERLASVLSETIDTTTPDTGNRGRDKVMLKRKRRWVHWIDTFRSANQLGVIAPVVPTFEPRLDKETYNDVLVDLSNTDPARMLQMLKTWPADVYDVSTVTKAIEGQLGMSSGHSRWTDLEREPLREGLLMMYGLSGRHDETLNLLLKEESSKVFDYIRSHHLHEAVRSAETIAGLFKIDANAATELLTHAPETVLPPDAIVPILTKLNNSQWTFMYLHSLFRMDPEQATKYHNLLLQLCVEHGLPGTLNTFLRTSTHYSLDVALEAMGGTQGFRKGHLARERVYVLSVMGDLNSAMNILLGELEDTLAAIEFASDHCDGVLWERLIEHAKTHANTLAALLDSPAGGRVDPVRLIPLLGSEMRIPHLRDRLHRILVDAALERVLREDAALALNHDAGGLLQELDKCVTVLPL